jgi:hypothetical protein
MKNVSLFSTKLSIRYECAENIKEGFWDSLNRSGWISKILKYNIL